MHIRGRSLPLTTYRNRRRQALKRLQSAFDADIPLLLIGIPEHNAGNMLSPVGGTPRQDPWFDYFTGCHEHDAALLIDPTATRSQQHTLFLEAGDPARIVWEGARLAPGASACKAFGIQRCAERSTLVNEVRAAAARAGGKLIMLTRIKEPGVQAEAFAHWNKKLRGIELLNGEPTLVHLRMYKDTDEIALIQKAIDTTNTGLRSVMAQMPQMKTESDIAAELLKQYVSPHHQAMAFPSIVGSGVNGATLHYPHNDCVLQKNAPILIDSGATYGSYCSDVTRTLPRSGVFSSNPRFRELYEIVLRANARGRAFARPGVSFAEWNDYAWQPILDAGFSRMHGLGHHMGMDVHDPADYTIGMHAGMVITNEPGIYLADENIGIRIEDDLLITADGCQELTKRIPKTIKAVEKAMRG